MSMTILRIYTNHENRPAWVILDDGMVQVADGRAATYAEAEIAGKRYAAVTGRKLDEIMRAYDIAPVPAPAAPTFTRGAIGRALIGGDPHGMARRIGTPLGALLPLSRPKLAAALNAAVAAFKAAPDLAAEIGAITARSKARKPAARVKVVCLDCGKRFTVAASRLIAPTCPKCGAADIEVRS